MRRPSDTGRMRYVNRLFGVVNMLFKRRYMAAAEIIKIVNLIIIFLAVTLVTCIIRTHSYKSRLQQIDRNCIVYQSFFKYNFINRQDYMEKIHIYVYIKDNTFKV